MLAGVLGMMRVSFEIINTALYKLGLAKPVFKKRTALTLMHRLVSFLTSSKKLIFNDKYKH